MTFRKDQIIYITGGSIMIKNLVLRVLCFLAIFAIVSLGFLIVTNLGSIGNFLMSIPTMVMALFTAIPMNIFTLIIAIAVWEFLAMIFSRGKRDNQQK